MKSPKHVKQKAGDASLQVGGDLVNHGTITLQPSRESAPHDLIRLYFNTYASLVMFVLVTIFMVSQIIWGDLRPVAERSVWLALLYASPIFMLEIAWFRAERQLSKHLKK